MSNCMCECQAPPIIKQGDAYPIPAKLFLNKEQITSDYIDLIAKVEFMLDERIRKVYPDDVPFADDAFLIPLTQEESFSFFPGETVYMDARIKFAQSHDVLGIDNPVMFMVIGAQSTEVI